MPFDFGNMALAAMDANKEYAATQEKLRATRETESLARDRMAQERDVTDQRLGLERERFGLERERLNQERAVYQGNEALRAATQKEAEARANKAAIDAASAAKSQEVVNTNQALMAGDYTSLGNVNVNRLGTTMFEVSMTKDPINGVPQSSSGVMYIPNKSEPPIVVHDDELAGAMSKLLPTDNPDEIYEKLSAEGLPTETIGLAINIQTSNQKQSGTAVSPATKANTVRALQSAFSGLTASISEQDQTIKTLTKQRDDKNITIGKGTPDEKKIESYNEAQAELGILSGKLDLAMEKDKEGTGPEVKKIKSAMTALGLYTKQHEDETKVIDQETLLKQNAIRLRDNYGVSLAKELKIKMDETPKGAGSGAGGGEPPPAPAKSTPDANLETLIQNNPDPAMRAALIEYQDEGRTQNTDETWSTKRRSAAEISDLVLAMRKGPEAVRALAGKKKEDAKSADVKTQLRKAEEAEPMSAPAYLGNAVLVGMKETAKDVGNAFAYGDPPKYGDLAAAGVPEVTVKDINTYWGLANKIEDTTLRSEIKAALKSRAPERTKIAITELAKRFPSKMESVEAIYARKAPPREPWFWEKPK